MMNREPTQVEAFVLSAFCPNQRPRDLVRVFQGFYDETLARQNRPEDLGDSGVTDENIVDELSISGYRYPIKDWEVFTQWVAKYCRPVGSVLHGNSEDGGVPAHSFTVL